MSILNNYSDRLGRSNVCVYKSIKGFLVFYFIIILSYILASPWPFSSGWHTSSDFHSCIEIVGSFMALLAGFSCLVYFFGLRNRYYLIIGLGFFIAGGEDLFHGILSFGRLTADMDVDFTRFVPATYVSGRLALAVFIIISPLLAQSVVPMRRLYKEAFLFSFLAALFGGGVSVISFKLDLPRFIYPHRFISRPVDFISAVLFLLAFFMIFNRFSTKRDIFSGFLLAGILFNLWGQLYMSFSKELYDALFDIAHLSKVFGYLMPGLGVALQGLDEAWRANLEVERKTHKESELIER